MPTIKSIKPCRNGNPEYQVMSFEFTKKDKEAGLLPVANTAVPTEIAELYESGEEFAYSTL